MKIYKEETVAHLNDDLTQSGVIFSILNLLAGSLQNIVSGGYKKIRIDCKKINKADIKGLQMLCVWMQSARTRGVEPELINMSDNLRLNIHSMGLDNDFTGFSKHKYTGILTTVKVDSCC